MNKRILLIFAALLAVSLVATPLLVGARKSKSAIGLVFYDLQFVSSETKECGRLTVETSQVTSQILVTGQIWHQGILPMYGGTAETFVMHMYDPETGYGTSRTRHTFDFGEYGSFKVYGWGKCAGKMPTPGGPVLGWFSAESECGFGRDAMKGTRLRLVGSLQVSLPDFMGNLPEEFVGTMGFLSSGEIIY